MKKNEETKKAANGGKQSAVDMMTENKLNTTTPATVDTPKKMFNLNNIYFDPLQISPDAPIRSALSPIGDIMRQRGRPTTL